MKYFHQHYVTWFSKEPYECNIILSSKCSQGSSNQVQNRYFSRSTNAGAPLPSTISPSHSRNHMCSQMQSSNHHCCSLLLWLFNVPLDASRIVTWAFAAKVPAASPTHYCPPPSLVLFSLVWGKDWFTPPDSRSHRFHSPSSRDSSSPRLLYCYETLSSISEGHVSKITL